MDRYNVPQFIDVEAKIIGPITARQFIIMLVACGLTFIWYKTLKPASFKSLVAKIVSLTL